MNKRKWLTLGVVSTALLLIPRRSSRQATLNAIELPMRESKAKRSQNKDSNEKNQNAKK